MPELGDRLRELVDGSTTPVTLDEVRAPVLTSADAGDERERHAHRARWIAVAAAAVVATLALVALLLGNLGDDARQVDVGGVGEGEQALFELLELRPGLEPMGTLRSAVTDDELGSLWRDVGFVNAPPQVDFVRWVVVSITIPDDACPPALGDFDRDGPVWTPQFVELDGDCNDPLIPKTYVVAIDRDEVTPSFTLRLPADETFGFDEQRLGIDVPPSPAGSTSSQPEQQRDLPVGLPPVAVVPLPPRGEARSHLLDDGRPIWVVHHEDGSASAVPAVVPPAEPSDPSGEDLDSMFWSLVRWSPQGIFRGPHTWDAWGRALTAGRHADLADYTAAVDGDEVVVRPSTTGRVAGSPVVPERAAGSLEDPELPQRVSVDEVAEGWSMVDAAAVGAEGVVRICEVSSDERFPPSTCPEGAPVLVGAVAPADTISWHFAPLLVRVNDGGEIDAAAPFGGMTATAVP